MTMLVLELGCIHLTTKKGLEKGKVEGIAK